MPGTVGGPVGAFADPTFLSPQFYGARRHAWTIMPALTIEELDMPALTIEELD